MKNFLKLSGIIVFIAVIGFTMAVLSLTGCDNGTTSGGNNNTIARGKSASVTDGIIALDDVTLDFGGNNVTSGTKMTVLLPTDKQKPDGMISGLFEVELIQECVKPATITIPVDEGAIPDDENAAVLLAIGSRYKDGKGEYTSYIYLPAAVSGGMASASFIPANFLQGLIAEGDEGGRKTPFTELFTAYIAIKRVHYHALFEVAPGNYIDGPFAIYSPYGVNGENEYESVFQSICGEDLEMMEDIYMFFEPHFSAWFEKRTVWPFQVYYDPDFQGGVKYETCTIKYDSGEPGSGQIYWNGNPADGIIRVGCTYQGNYNFDQKTYKSRFAHEFSHFLISCGVENYNDVRWGDEAFAGLGARAAGGGFDTEALANYRLLFNGLIPKNNTAAEGYARSLLLYYIASRIEDALSKPMTQIMWDMTWVLKQDPSQDLDAVLSANTEDTVIGFYESLIGYSSRGLNRAFGTPADYYTGALSGSLGKRLNCDKPKAGKTIAGQVTLPVNYYGAQFAAITFSKALLDAMETASEDDSLEINLTGDGDLRLYAISPGGEIQEQAEALEDIMDKIAAGWKYLVMVVGYEKGAAPANYTVTFEFQEEEDDSTWYGNRFDGTRWTGQDWDSKPVTLFFQNAFTFVIQYDNDSVYGVYTTDYWTSTAAATLYHDDEYGNTYGGITTNAVISGSALTWTRPGSGAVTLTRQN